MKKKLNITFLLPMADLSGGIRVIGIYAKKLWNKGHNVTIISQLPPKYPLKTRVKMVLKGEFPKALGLKTKSHLDNIEVPHIVLPKEKLLNKDSFPDADIIIGTWWETMEIIAKLPRKKGVPCHFVQHYEAIVSPKEKVDAVLSIDCPKITVSYWLKDLLIKKFKAKKVICVLNTVDFNQFNAPPREKNNPINVGMCYRDLYYKGTDIMINAFNIAKSKDSKINLYAFGDTNIIKKLPLPEGTKYWKKPKQEEIKNIYSSCDVWLFGSRTEGFGLPIIEAMACRTPVIATPAGVAPEKIEKGGGILVPHEDPEAMAQAILKISKMDPIEWKKMSDAAYNSVVGYTWDDAADRFEEALFEILGYKNKVKV